jgi:hypothetical protein
MPRVILLASIRLLNGVRALLLAAGVAGLAAAAASGIFTYVNGGSASGWAAPFQGLMLAAIGAFLAAALGFSALMPRTADVVPDRANGRGSSPLPVVAVLAVLALLTILQAPAVVAWWEIDRTLLAEAMGVARDPLGLHLIPTVILLSLPTLAVIALGSCVLTSSVGIFARADRAVAALSACGSRCAACDGSAAPCSR